MKPNYLNNGKTHILYDADVLHHVDDEYFNPLWWKQRDALTGSAMGRGRTVFVRQGEGEYVLRHYRRGGMIALFSDDRYLWAGLDKSRPWREWHLLARLYGMGLPVPRPVAARLQRRGLSYSADILMEKIPAPSLCQRLLEGPLEPQRWQKIGACIRCFHDAGVYHADMNAHNILLTDGGGVYLIDFDRGELREDPDGAWKQSNLDRLQRSLRKLINLRLDFHFEEQDWKELLCGYADTSTCDKQACKL